MKEGEQIAVRTYLPPASKAENHFLVEKDGESINIKFPSNNNTTTASYMQKAIKKNQG
jgi:hypothetical protein